MTDLQLRNLFVYCAIAAADMVAIALAAALATGSVVGFREGEFMAPAAPTLATVLAVLVPILSTALAASRPRWGSEEIAHDVDVARKAGVSQRRLTVKPKGPAPTPVLSDEDVDRIAKRGLAVMREGQANG